MDGHRFDALTKALSGRLSRRGAVRRSVGGLVAAVGAVAVRRGAAQEATPVASPIASAAVPAEPVSFLFVQTFGSGTFEPKPGADGVYTLSLNEGTDQTVYFSDRPQRIVGTVPMQQFLDGLGFAPDDPPNAALVAQTEAGEDVLVVELLNPSYDETAGTLTYDVRVLADYGGEGLASLAARQDDQALAEQFGAASLFIDGCPGRKCFDGSTGTCVRCDQVTCIGQMCAGQCVNCGALYQLDTDSCTCFCVGSDPDIYGLGCPCTTGTQNPCPNPNLVCTANEGSMPGGPGTCSTS